MKTKNQKQSKVTNTLLLISVIVVVAVYIINEQNSLSDKYKIGTGNFEDKSGYEVSYINLTGTKTIEEKKIKLSEGYWSSGKFNF